MLLIKLAKAYRELRNRCSASLAIFFIKWDIYWSKVRGLSRTSVLLSSWLTKTQKNNIIAQVRAMGYEVQNHDTSWIAYIKL